MPLRDPVTAWGGARRSSAFGLRHLLGRHDDRVAPRCDSGGSVAERRGALATLHIEHPITDLRTWLGAFARFEEARQRAGVRTERVRQPVDDDEYIYVDLDFDSAEQATASGSSWKRGWVIPGCLARACWDSDRRARARIPAGVGMNSSLRNPVGWPAFGL